MRQSFFYLSAAAVALTGMLAGCSSQKRPLEKMHTRASAVVLFDNDVHCQIDRYPVLAGYRDAVADTAFTALVSCGDFVQGATSGAISKGQYCIDIMKRVGYDALTLGNHEFDYKMPRLTELLAQLGDSIVVDANLVDYRTRQPLYRPYLIKKLGKHKIAFLGLTTPGTLYSEAYAFYDDNGRQAWDLMDADFFGMVQRHIDAARAEGARYVIVLSHLGEEPTPMHIDSHKLIANTTGIDAVLDGHSHNVVAPMTLPDKEGKPVTIAQTGSKLQNIGKLVIIPNGKLTVELVPVQGLRHTSQSVQHAVDSVMAEMQAVVSREVCRSPFELRVTDASGDETGRRSECNAGDLVTDAFRITTGADLAVLNTGGIRNNLPSGTVTYGDMVNMLPYDNNLCLAEVTGTMIEEMLRANVASLPANDSQFPQVSGVRFTARVADHSVADIEILDPATGQYVPLDPGRTYTLASSDYCIYNGGLRNTLKQAKLTRDAIINYRDAVTDYLARHLDGSVPPQYAAPDARIKIVE